MPSIPKPPKHFGLVDHDADLRHSLLGAYLVCTVVLNFGSIVLFFLDPNPIRLSGLVPPIVLTVGTAIQYLLWRQRKDRVFSIVLIATFFWMFVGGTLANGILSPATPIPILMVVLSGYLLGTKIAYRVGIVSLAFLFLAYFATRMDLLPHPNPPSSVWARVLVTLIFVSGCALIIPLHGLLSGVRLIEQEKAALELSILRLEEKQSLLAREVKTRTRELELANSDLKAFSSALSHDLRTPLRSIQTHAATLESADLSSHQKQLLARIQMGVAKLESDIKETLRHTRGQADS
ncbi:MAG TPA: histidine kinase dimerization/phospho-acceptor domain-containing protein [Fibrobacteria bacterium]|nr:histidine kinase dimerization/phospho-acceptor domain-containing protein [Fibrobacteria bacterium]